MMRVTILAAGLGVILLAGCKGDGGASATVASEPIVTVGRENIAIATLQELRSGPPISGSLEAEQAADVRAEVGGIVLSTYADAGQRVKQGALLAKLEDTAVRDAYLSARSAVRSAEAALQLAKRNAQRAERLSQVGAIADKELESERWNATSAEGALADAKARLASADKQLRDTEVRAPFSGVVSNRAADAGDVVQVGSELFTLLDPRTLRLEGSVPAEEIGRLKVGTEVEFTVNGLDRRITGRIQRINPAVDPATRQVRIYVTIPNLDQALVAGLFAEGRVATDSKRAVAIPATAVDNRGTQPTVHRINAGRVAEAGVRLGVRDEVAELVEVQAGVSEGDTVLQGSAQGITPGTRVRVIEEEVER